MKNFLLKLLRLSRPKAPTLDDIDTHLCAADMHRDMHLASLDLAESTALAHNEAVQEQIHGLASEIAYMNARVSAALDLIEQVKKARTAAGA